MGTHRVVLNEICNVILNLLNLVGLQGAVVHQPEHNLKPADVPFPALVRALKHLQALRRRIGLLLLAARLEGLDLRLSLFDLLLKLLNFGLHPVRDLELFLRLRVQLGRCDEALL